MVFLVGGYDEDQPYGRVFEVFIPNRPEPLERHEGDFGMVWGGNENTQTDLLRVLILAFLPSFNPYSS